MHIRTKSRGGIEGVRMLNACLGDREPPRFKLNDWMFTFSVLAGVCERTWLHRLHRVIGVEGAGGLVTAAPSWILCWDDYDPLSTSSTPRPTPPSWFMSLTYYHDLKGTSLYRSNVQLEKTRHKRLSTQSLSGPGVSLNRRRGLGFKMCVLGGKNPLLYLI